MKNKFDIIVIGGGIAGIAAAVKAGNMGAKVALVEHYPFVGGMSTAGMVSPFMKHTINNKPLVRGVFESLETEMSKINGMIDNGFYAVSFRASANKLLANAGCHLFMSSSLVAVNKSNKFVRSITIQNDSQSLVLEANVFIDTSGDAQLVYLADMPWEKGNVEEGNLQALTLFFRMAGIDMPKALDYVSNNKSDFFDWMEYDFNLNKIISVAGYFDLIKTAQQKGVISEELQYIFFTTLPNSGEASFNTTNILGLDGSSSEDITVAELKGREQTEQIVKLLINNVPGFEDAFLLETAVQVGVRETRRAVGEYMFSGEDVRKGTKFNDAVARACYGIDIHGQNDDSIMEHLEEGNYYDIPVRSLIVKKAENVLVAGRCISSTREGQSAVRIMPTAAATGEACGALGSLAVKNNVNVRNIPVKSLQNEILYNIK